MTTRTWTTDELEKLLPKAERQAIIDNLADGIETIAAGEVFEIRAFPHMTVEESVGWFDRFLDIASVRPLTRRECFMFGQWRAVYMMAIKTETLGYRGRYLVFTEDDVKKLRRETK